MKEKEYQPITANLVKVARMSMVHSLEIRVPSLGTDMVTFCMNLSSQMKLHRGKIRKYILRQSLRNRIPKDILNHPKSGFNVPVEKRMHQTLK